MSVASVNKGVCPSPPLGAEESETHPWFIFTLAIWDAIVYPVHPFIPDHGLKIMGFGDPKPPCELLGAFAHFQVMENGVKSDLVHIGACFGTFLGLS